MSTSSSIGPSAPTLRHFEFLRGTSQKFWEVSTDGNQVTVRFGRIGTDGQTQVKSFDDSDAATRHAERLIQSKRAKGYQDIAKC